VCFDESSNAYQLTEKGKTFLRSFEDYSRSRNELDRQLLDVKSLMTRLERLCTLKDGGSKPVDPKTAKGSRRLSLSELWGVCSVISEVAEWA